MTVFFHWRYSGLFPSEIMELTETLDRLDELTEDCEDREEQIEDREEQTVSVSSSSYELSSLLSKKINIQHTKHST